MTSIGILGAGIGGLHLGLYLQRHGIAATIYTEKTPPQQRASQLRNIVVRSGPTRTRERLLGVNHWDTPDMDLWHFNMHLGGERPLAFSGRFEQPAQVVDMRMYWARLLEDFAVRGGNVVFVTLRPHDVPRLAAQHDLLVLASGRGQLANLFERIPEHCPYDRPQRLVLAGLFRGIDPPQPNGFDVSITPGHGEILVFPMISSEPGLTGLGIEMIPGGAFEAMPALRSDDAQQFNAAVLNLLYAYAPAVYQRIDRAAFGLTRPQDRTFTAITPTWRRGYTRLANNRLIVALGDAHVLIDPLSGQGANTASHSAWVLGEAIGEGPPFDEAFCHAAEQRMLAYAGPVTNAANARLHPPAPHAIQLMAAAARHQPLADMYAQGFNHPDWFWEIVSSPERTDALLRQSASEQQPTVAVAA